MWREAARYIESSHLYPVFNKLQLLTKTLGDTK